MTALLSLLLAPLFTFVELNCENLFDYTHDEGKNDYEYLPTAQRKWDKKKYWRKVNNTAKTILACGEEGNAAWALPDMVALCEVENDSVLNDLTHRSLLRHARYEYVMTESADERGVDVALLYSPFSFRLLQHHAVRVKPPGRHHATRDILYASGIVADGDTLHVMVVHAPSRMGGAAKTRPFRMAVAQQLCGIIDSLRLCHDDPRIIIAGDFNDYANDSTLMMLARWQLSNVSEQAQGTHGAQATYKYQGKWRSLDHIVVSHNMQRRLAECFICDTKYLLEKDPKYGGVKPRRNYVGMKWNKGFSDHLPLVARFRWDEE